MEKKSIRMQLSHKELGLIYEALRSWYKDVRDTECEHRLRTGLSPFYNTYSKDILNILDRIKGELKKNNIMITICRGSEYRSFKSVEEANKYLSKLTTK